MSGDIGTGSKSRRILTIIAAIFAVAMMLAVPLITAAGTDADFAKDEAGYKVELKDPSDAQLTKVKMSKVDFITGAMEGQLAVFNMDEETGVFDVPTVTAESFSAMNAEGCKVTSDTYVMIDADNVNVKGVTLTYNVSKAGKLMNPDREWMNDKSKAAADAIELYLGADVAVGDKVIITGVVKEEVSSEISTEYLLLDDNKCYDSKTTTSTYIVDDIDVTFKLVKADASEKSIRLVSTVKATIIREEKNDFGGAEVKVGVKYTVKDDLEYTYSGDIYYDVNGKDYSILTEPKPIPDHEETVMALFDQSDMSINSYFKNKVAGLPASEEGMAVDKTYDAAESAYNDVMMDAIGNDLLKLLLIIGGVIIGVIVLIIVLIIVLVVVMKKKKKQ